ncbi:MAG: hypothetical protein P4L57_15535 [Rhizomicrobium sp.]|nr:hypothetical protein [Rhizomicrobium sp.]
MFKADTDLTKRAIQLSEQDLQRREHPSPEALWIHALHQADDAFHIFQLVNDVESEMAAKFSPACSVSVVCEEIHCEDLLLGNIALGIRGHGAITFQFHLFFTLDSLWVNWGPSEIKYNPACMTEFEKHLVEKANKLFPLLH